ncbi:hypothetical protein BGX38DRAFT_1178324 [Terfezia claveryi]|nr:hypothetical protein BGX38DRAFT_1178324 [Terfezia claveryi]
MEVTNFTNSSKQAQLPEYCVPAPRIRVLGAFDTVKTVITLPVHNLVQGGIPIIDFKLDAPALVDHFRHALALNEQRSLFSPSFWKSDSQSSDRSYLEAWFFGHHHDIGGGDDFQGLALWPLQWILHASMESGLILDSTIKPYDILFTGANNVFETPHEISLQMFDMIRHHAESRGKWGLKLNKPFSPTIPEPREFFQFVTKPPYVRFRKPKVFIHPAAYLVFDVSSIFRIQVYTWKHFRRFLADRSAALSMDCAPWWEKQTINTIVNEASAVQSFNLLVIGRPNSGKESIITTIFGKPTGPANKGIHNHVPIAGNDEVRIHYSNGFGEGGSDGRIEVQKFLKAQLMNPDHASRIHAIWYFHDCLEERVNDSEEDLFKMNFGDLPVLVFLQNENSLRSRFRQHMDISDGSDADVKIQNAFAEAIDRIQGQLSLPKTGRYVHMPGMASETPGNLLEESATCLDHDSVYISQIKAQRVEVKPKIALAIEETIRAYTIWYLFDTSGEVHSFGRNKDSAGVSLSTLLMEPVLATFSMGFSGDSELIKRHIGSSWVDLDKHTSGICDTSLPSYLLLICMLDTIIVMTHAVAHRDKSKNEALPVTHAEIEQACTWYAVAHKLGQETIQKSLHKQVHELLQPDGYPKDKSVAHLQMKTIAIVERFSEEAEKGSTTILAAAAAAVSGAVTGAIAGVGGKIFGMMAR